MPLFETEISISCLREVVFDFLCDPRKVVGLNPPEMSFTLIEAPEMISEGSQIRFQIEAFGFKQSMLHEITNFRSPEGFLLREVEGVLKKFEHLHRLEAQPDGGTILYERIVYEPPGGMVGFLLTEAKVRDGLEKNFAHRHAELKRQLEQA